MHTCVGNVEDGGAETLDHASERAELYQDRVEGPCGHGLASPMTPLGYANLQETELQGHRETPGCAVSERTLQESSALHVTAPHRKGNLNLEWNL